MLLGWHKSFPKWQIELINSSLPFFSGHSYFNTLSVSTACYQNITAFLNISTNNCIYGSNIVRIPTFLPDAFSFKINITYILHFISSVTPTGWPHSSFSSHEGLQLWDSGPSESSHWSSHSHRFFSSNLNSDALSSFLSSFYCLKETFWPG